MRILLLSDIHANFEALETVLKNAPEHDAVWCLGDIVGYGPNPNKCIQLIREQPGLKIVLGNHDAAAINTISSDNFNPTARTSATWTREQLTDESKEFLASLPETIETDLGLLVHGSPSNHIMEYLLGVEKAEKNFRMFKGDFCFVGHSHLPLVFRKHQDGSLAEHLIKGAHKEVRLQKRMICNPGSLGQPRDRNPKSSYALIDSESMTISYHRTAYDVEKTKLLMARYKLPLRHITRLEFGW